MAGITQEQMEKEKKTREVILSQPHNSLEPHPKTHHGLPLTNVASQVFGAGVAIVAKVVLGSDIDDMVPVMSAMLASRTGIQPRTAASWIASAKSYAIRWKPVSVMVPSSYSSYRPALVWTSMTFM